MEKLYRTPVNLEPFPFEISYPTPTLFMGSCFAENVGDVLRIRKFPVNINPFGVQYNPVSVAMGLRRIISGENYSLDDIRLYNNLWYSFGHHTSFSSVSKDECLQRVNQSLNQAKDFWASTKFLIVTFGTARVYYHNELGLSVANCHKIPAREFTNKLLNVEEIVDLWSELLKDIFEKRGDIKVVFTVSPIRHWKDGAHGNQISKATLLLATSKIVELFTNRVFYFPAYEIMMDELRDYRFYADDMLHPSALAVNHIWEKFKHATISPETQKIISEVEKVVAGLNHRPFNANTNEYKMFVEKLRKKLTELEAQVKGIDFANEQLSLPTNI